MSDLAKVLVVDDDALFCEAAALTLRGGGYEVYACESIAEASEILREQRADVLVADLQIPGNAGLEWLTSLACNYPQLAIVLCTGYPTLETAITAVGLPILAYLVKPVAAERLLESVRAACARTRSAPATHARQAPPPLLDPEGRPFPLSPRQLQVLELVARGLSNKEIARQLGCAVRTVELHVSEVLRRTGAESRASLIARLWAGHAGRQAHHETS